MRRAPARACLAALFIASLAFVAGPVLAAGVQLDPGMWEFETVTALPRLPQPVTTKNKRCIDESQVDPLDAMEADSRCKVTDRATSGRTLTWNVTCPGPKGEPMNGHGEVTSEGDSMSGKMVTSLQVNGQPVNMTVSWTGKRIGPCE